MAEAIHRASPRRGVWGGPPGGGEPQPIAATGLAFARRGASLPRLVVKNIPEIGVRAYRKRPKPRPRPVAPAPAPAATEPAGSEPIAAPASPAEQARRPHGPIDVHHRVYGRSCQDLPWRTDHATRAVGAHPSTVIAAARGALTAVATPYWPAMWPPMMSSG